MQVPRLDLSYNGKLHLGYRASLEAPACEPSASSSAALASTLAVVAAKTPRGQEKENPSCAWRSRQPQWRRPGVTDYSVDRAKYWNDDSYATFYETSAEERQTMTASLDGAGLAPLGAAKLAASWRRHGYPAPSSSTSRQAASKGGVEGRGLVSDLKAGEFQQAFASLSRGQHYIRTSQALELFRSLGTPLAPTAMERLLQEDAQSDASDKLTYEKAFRMYEQVLFPDVAKALVNDALEDFVQEVLGRDGTDCIAVTVDEKLGRLYQPLARPGREVATSLQNAGAKKPQVLTAARDKQYSAIYRLPPQSSPRTQSIFRKVGRFTVCPSDA